MRVCDNKKKICSNNKEKKFPLLSPENTMAESVLQEALKAFIMIGKVVDGEGRANKDAQKDAKLQKEQAKKFIIAYFQENNIKYYFIDGIYLVLKQTSKKPTLNPEFISQAYLEFHRSQQKAIQSYSPEQIAVHFGQYIPYYQGQNMILGDADLKISKSKPVAAILFE